MRPEFVEEMLIEYQPSSTLRSADFGQRVEPGVQSKHGEGAFSCYAALKWNKLPTKVKLVNVTWPHPLKQVVGRYLTPEQLWGHFQSTASCKMAAVWDGEKQYEKQYEKRSIYQNAMFRLAGAA